MEKTSRGKIIHFQLTQEDHKTWQRCAEFIIREKSWMLFVSKGQAQKDNTQSLILYLT